MFASGDDTVVLHHPSDNARILNGIRLGSSSDKHRAAPYGIGQVIVEISQGTRSELEFLSKKFHYNGDKLFAHPDYHKVLETKEFYRGANYGIHSNPYAYMELKRL